VSTPFLNLTGIDYAIGTRPILNGIDLTLEAGRIYGLVGPNGSGKSTLLKIIARQIAPKSGAIAFNGKAATDWGSRAFARHVAYMPQFTPATDGMTAREWWHLAVSPGMARSAASASQTVRWSRKRSSARSLRISLIVSSPACQAASVSAPGSP